MDTRSIRHKRALKKALAWSLWAAILLVIVWGWAANNGQTVVSGNANLALLAVARLIGLIATFCVLVQVVVMGRAGWLEPVFGLDKLAIFHRRNGLVAFVSIVLHPMLMTVAYVLVSNTGPIQQYLTFLSDFPYVPLALIAEVLFIGTVGASLYVVRKHLQFEIWYFIHLFNYAAVGLVVWHQLANGSTVQSSPAFYYFWIALYVFAVSTIIWWRWLRPVVRWKKFNFKVQKVQAATPSVTSVYIEGKNLQSFGAKAGQFVMVRFLTKGIGHEEHPFSLSMMPSDTQLRITARQLGDFTKKLPNLPVGTSVIVSGPYGSFTHELQLTNKVVYIAGGIGITPIRALLQERASWQDKGDAVLLYGNRSLPETALRDEVQDLAQTIGMPVHNVLSDQPDYAGEKGYIDKEKIQRLVPDIAQRDVYVCGPPPMVQGVLAALRSIGVPEKYIHFERFSLHKQ